MGLLTETKKGEERMELARAREVEVGQVQLKARSR